MYNSVYLIGRLTADPDLSVTSAGKEFLSITIAVQRGYKNSDGIYEADFVRCKLWDAIATRTSEYCKKGDLVALRGQIRNSSYLSENEEKKYKTEIIVEKISFLTAKDDSKFEE